MKQFLEAGKAVATHGIQGELRVYPWSDSALDLCKLKTVYLDEQGKRALPVESARVHKSMALMKFQGFDSIEEARKLIDRVFYLNRDDLTLRQDSFFIADLIGMRVVDADDAHVQYGTLHDVTNNGAYDIYHIQMPGDKIGMVPAVNEMIIEINTESNVMRIRPAKGLLSDAD